MADQLTRVAAHRERITVTDWDGLSARVHPGDGIVARTPGAALIVPRPNPQQREALDQLLGLVRTARAGGGRSLARRLAGILASSDDDTMDLALLAPLGGGDIAVLVVGDVEVTADGSDGAVTISGRDSVTWVDRVLRAPSSVHISGGSGDGDGQDQAGSAFELSDLVVGIVPGAGLSLAPRGDVPALDASAALPAQSAPPESTPGRSAPAQAAARSGPAQAPPAPVAAPLPVPETAAPDEQPGGPIQYEKSGPPPQAPAPVPAEAPQGDFQVESLSGDSPPSRPPLPVEPEEAGQSSTPSGAAAPQVKGVYCKRGHFNDPMVQFCTVCGINMVQQTPALVDGPRPPLGVLVFDDGSVFQLEQDYVLGRQPEQAPEVLAGTARPLRLEDSGGTISRAHALIALEDWTVRISDHGSANGTYIAMPNSPDWQPVPRNGRIVLTPGTTIKLGNRTLKYESHRGARA
jgi:hypothetical protein